MAFEGSSSSTAEVREFERLVRDLERPLGSFVAQMIRTRVLAEDVLQETFLVAWRQRYSMPAAPNERRAWLYGVARNQALSALRKKRRHERAIETMGSGQTGDTRSATEAVVMRDLLARALPPSDRSLFVLRYAHGFTAEALAEMTGLRAATVRKRLERSSKRLRGALEAQGISTHQESSHEQKLAPT